MKILFIILALIQNNSYDKSPFEFKTISSKNNVVEIIYDGKLSAVADSDTTKLESFSFISIGKLKEASAVANGIVYVKFVFGAKQTIMVEAGEKQSNKKTSWKPIESSASSLFQSDFQAYKKSNNRESYYLELDRCRVYLINIKKEHIELFKWMASTIEFITK